MRREYESKFATLRTEHGKKLDSERRRFDSLVDANNKESAERLHRETEALRKTQAEMKKVRVSFYFRIVWAIRLTGKCFVHRSRASGERTRTWASSDSSGRVPIVRIPA